MFKVNDLCAGYGPIPVISDISLEVRAGEVCCLVGRNGVGKTTTLRALVGLAQSYSGRIEIDGQAMIDVSPVVACGRGVGYVAQVREICHGLSVHENLLLPVYANSLPRSSIDEIYVQFQRLSERRNQLAGTLSGGERKVLAFARTMLLRPRVYLIDEPTEGLMPKAVDEIAKLIGELARAGAAIVLVEQNLEVISSVATQVCFMNNGRIERSTNAPSSEQFDEYLGVH